MSQNQQLSTKQRQHLQDIISGKKRMDSKTTQEFLANPSVAVTLEATLDEAGLSDNALAGKLSVIMNRKATKSITKTGALSTNQTAVDSNSLNAIKLIWQVRGKFTDKHEVNHQGAIGTMTDNQLDKIIKSGSDFLKVNKVQISHGDKEKDVTTTNA